MSEKYHFKSIGDNEYMLLNTNDAVIVVGLDRVQSELITTEFNDLLDELKELEYEYKCLKEELKEEKWFSEKIDEDLDVYRSKCLRLQEESKKSEEAEERLFDYFFNWFEEERGTNIEDFNLLWKNLKEGCIDEEDEDY